MKRNLFVSKKRAGGQSENRMIETLEARCLLSAGFVFVGSGSPTHGAQGDVTTYTPTGDFLNNKIINAGDAGLAISGSNVFVLTGADNTDPNFQVPGELGEYSQSGTAVNASLLSNLHDPRGFAISGSHIFVIDGNGTVGEYTTAGATVDASLISGLTNPLQVAVDGSDLFVTSGSFGASDGKIGEYSLTGATINASLVTGLSLQVSYAGFAASGSDLFVSTTSGIAEYSTSGATINSAFTSVAGTYGLTVFESNLYVIDGAIDEYDLSGNHISSLPLITYFHETYINIAIAAAAPVGATPLHLSDEVDFASLGSALPPTVCLEDADGELVTDVAKTVTLSIASGPDGGELTGTTSVPLDDGAASFTDFGFTVTGTYTVTASDGGDTPVTSGNIAWKNYYSLAITGLPGVSVTGVNPDDSTVQVELLDKDGNLVTNNSASITVTEDSNVTGTLLGGTTTLPVGTNGIAVFSDLFLNKFASYTLIANSDAETAAVEATTSFTLSYNPSTVVSVVGSPGAFTVGQPVEFSATVLSMVPGQTAPTGTVNFVDSDGDVLATSPVDGNGTATFSTTFIQPGNHVVTATYSGDSNYTAGTSASFTEMSATPVSTNTQSFGKVKLPSAVINGVTFGSSIPLKISAGALKLNGVFTIKLYAEPVSGVDGSQVFLTQVSRKLSIKAKGAAVVAIGLKSIPATVAAGEYHLVAEVLDPTGAVSTTVTANAVEVSAPVIEPVVTVAPAGVPIDILRGEKGWISFEVTNEGNVAGKGLLISLTGNIVGEPQVVLGTYEAKKMVLKPGKTVKIRMRFSVAKDAEAGFYFAALNATLGGVSTIAYPSPLQVG